MVSTLNDPSSTSLSRRSASVSITSFLSVEVRDPTPATIVIATRTPSAATMLHLTSFLLTPGHLIAVPVAERASDVGQLDGTRRQRAGGVVAGGSGFRGKLSSRIAASYASTATTVAC